MNEDAKKNDGKIRLHGQEIKCRILEGEEEKQFWYNIENMPANKNCRNKRYIRLGVGCRDTAAAKLAEYASQKLMEKNEARKNIANAKFLKGQILYVTELPTTFVNFGLLKDFFNEYVPVAYADYEQGSSEVSCFATFFVIFIKFLSSGFYSISSKKSEYCGESFGGDEGRCKE